MSNYINWDGNSLTSSLSKRILKWHTHNRGPRGGSEGYAADSTTCTEEEMKTEWQLWAMEHGSKTTVTSQKLRPGAHNPCSRPWNIFLVLCSYDSPAFPLHWSSKFKQQWHILTEVFQPFRWESRGSWGSSQSIKVLCPTHRNCNDQHRAYCNANTQRSFYELSNKDSQQSNSH